MADTAVAGGLMPHQKDEHDIWICKDCGWKYPNAKPSPKIRKNHKKHCPGKAGAGAHAAGGSSDDASDDDHHHHSHVKGSVAPRAVNAPVPPGETPHSQIELVPPEEDLKSEAAPGAAPVVNGAAKEAEAPAQKKAPTHVAAPASPGGLMPHQKDEHDIWICKACGWKYPNAKPSPKIRKNHKKHCPGKGGSGAPGGSSDEASDDEHHHAPAHPAAAVDSGREGAVSSAAAPAEAPTSTSKEIDFAALKESPGPQATEVTSAADISPEAGNGTKEFSPPAELEKAVPQEALVPDSVDPEAAAVSGLMAHQKDEHDIWTCKDCGWKYPNAKPSPKIRKHHKQKCPGNTSGAAATTGGESDEASDGEHHLSSAVPAAPVGIPPAVEPGKEVPAAAPEVPRSISKEIDFAALKESSNPAVENETPAASTDGATPAVAATETPTKDAGAVSLKEAISKETDKEKEAPIKAVSLQEAIDKETQQEKDSASSTGLMLHQKDESDIWICKDCGWKYPNAKPSPKIRKHHKKKCPGNTGNGAPGNGATDDEASDDEHHSTKGAETATDKDLKGSTSSVTEAEVPGTQTKSREFSFKDALLTSDAAPAAEEKATETEDPAKATEPEQAPPMTVGGLLVHQKHEDDMWVCKACGWRYPNARPSAKIRKNHKKKCPKQGGAAKGTKGGSSDGTSSDDEMKLKGGKCFPCL